VSIRDEWIVLDTNIWIFGLRRGPDFPACAELLDNLNRFYSSNSFLAHFASLRESNIPDQIRETC